MSLVRPREYEFDVLMENEAYEDAVALANKYVASLQEHLDLWINKAGEAELQLTLKKREADHGGND